MMDTFDQGRTIQHTVTTTHNPATGIVVLEEWRKPDQRPPDGLIRDWKNVFGDYDRTGGPALIFRDGNTGVAIWSVWIVNGQPQRGEERDPVSGALTKTVVWDEKGERIDTPVPATRPGTGAAITSLSVAVP